MFRDERQVEKSGHKKVMVSLASYIFASVGVGMKLCIKQTCLKTIFIFDTTCSFSKMKTKSK